MMAFSENNSLPLKREYTVSELCDIIHCSTAKVLAVYVEDFYKDSPTLTVNEFGKGKAYYLAAKAESQFYKDFYGVLVHQYGVQKSLDAVLPYGVTACKRTGNIDLVFLQNFNDHEVSVELSTPMEDFETDEPFEGNQKLSAYEIRILRRKSK
jgi:beta-galactosidase